MANTGPSTRALEIHGLDMWEGASVRRALDFMQAHDLNALVFHHGDLLNSLVFPRSMFGVHQQWTSAPPRRGENFIHNTRAYIADVIAACKARGIDFYLELKELAFPDEVLERFPELVVNGAVCPSHPRWEEVVRARYQELCADFGDLAGVIVSVGSPEGRATLAARRCGCERCQAAEATVWHRWITSAISDVLRPAGKRLVVREFSYNPADQQAVLDALAALPADVEYCVKPYVRDFYPTYPDNPALAALTDRSTWLEYDVHGQYYGWGVFPCPVVGDLADRLGTATARGIDGLIMRTDWERINDLTCFDTANLVNLAAGARLARDVEADPVDVLEQAARSTGLLSAQASGPQAQEAVALLGELWPLLRDSLYIRGFVFNNNSTLCDGVSHAWWNMTRKHSLADWHPDWAARIDVADRGAVGAMLAEKDAAMVRADAVLPALAAAVDAGTVRIADPCWLGDVTAWMARYVEAFARCGSVVVLSAAVAHHDDLRSDLDRQLRGLADFQGTARAAGPRDLPAHQARMLLDPDRIERILSDGREALRQPDQPQGAL